MDFSKSRYMDIDFSSGVLILHKNQQTKASVLVLLILITSLYFLGFKTEVLENNYLYFHFY